MRPFPSPISPTKWSRSGRVVWIDTPRSSMPPLPVSMSTCAPNCGGNGRVTSPEPVSTYSDSISASSSRRTFPDPVSMFASGDLTPEAVTFPDPVSTFSTSTSTRSALTSPDPVSSFSWRPCAPATITLPDPVSRVTSPSASATFTSPEPVPMRRPLRMVGGHVRGRHVHLQISVDVRDKHAPHHQIHGHPPSRRDRDAQVGVGLEPPPRAGDPHAMAAARAVSLAIIEGPVLPDVEGGVAVEVEPAIHDGVVGIDHAQRLPAAHGTGLDPQLVEVAPTPAELHDDCGAGSAFDPRHAHEIVHGDVVAGDGMPLRLL